MAKSVGVAEVKRRFSEYTSRTRYQGERFVIKRKGSPVAAMVSIEDLRKLEKLPNKEKKGLLGSIGAWADNKKIDKIVDDIYTARCQSVDREIKRLA